MTHLRFEKRFIAQHIGNFSEKHKKVSKFASKKRLSRKLHVTLKIANRDCVARLNREHKGKRHITTYYCDVCVNKPRMHIGRYHIK